jgi:WD40 repeat protein
MRINCLLSFFLAFTLLLHASSLTNIYGQIGDETKIGPKYSVIRVYELEKGIREVSMSGDGSSYTIAGKGYVSFFNFEAESSKWTFKKDDLVDAMRMSRNGRYIAVGLEHAAVYCFSSVSGNPYWHFRPDGPALCVDISNEGQLVSVGTFFGVNYLLECPNRVVRWVYKYPRNVTVLAVTVSGNGKTVASGTHDGTINVFTSESNNPIIRFQANDFIFSLDSSSDGGVVVAGGNDSYVYFFDVIERELRWRFKAKSSVRSVSISDDGRCVVAGDYDGGVYSFNSFTGEMVWNYWIRGLVKSVYVSPDGNLVYVGGTDRTLHIFEARTGELVGSVEADHWVTTISSSTDGSRVLFGSGEKAYLVSLDKSVLTSKLNGDSEPAYISIYHVVAPICLLAALTIILFRKRGDWKR